MDQGVQTNVGDLRSGLRFAHLLASAAGLGVFVTIERSEGLDYIAMGKWAGLPFAQSLSPYIAPVKAAELHYAGQPEPGQTRLTPTDMGLGLGWKGGARRGNYTVAVSNMAEQHDLLLAIIVLYGLEHEVRLHHVGVRFPTLDEFQKTSVARGKFILACQTDHLSHFHPVLTDREHGGKYWVEYQYWPEGPWDRALHWDIVTKNPRDFLAYVSRAFGNKTATLTIFADPGGDNPEGVIWVPGETRTLGVVARENWSDPATW